MLWQTGYSQFLTPKTQTKDRYVMVDPRIIYTLCIGEVRKTRLPGEGRANLFLGSTIIKTLYFRESNFFTLELGCNSKKLGG